jgi:pimeloyl-ACP methyl ester carboxylesterase
MPDAPTLPQDRAPITLFLMNEASSRSAPFIGSAASGPQNVFVSAPDGLRLHIRDYGAAKWETLPIVCLPGLTRTTADFDVIALALASGTPPRRVIALDSRGRGESGYDPNPQHYNLTVELADLVAVLHALQIGPAVFLGSSRGGILTMLLAATDSAAIAGAILHDIGPVIEPAGLARIRSYVGKLRQPASFAEGADILRRSFEAQFPKLTPEQWLGAARRAWKPVKGALVPTYDVQIATTVAEFDSGRPPPPLWDAFDALARTPILVIRGANSDLLSPATVSAMREHCPGLDSIEVPDQGHVPLLEGAALLQRVAAFVAKCERAAQLQKA